MLKIYNFMRCSIAFRALMKEVKQSILWTHPAGAKPITLQGKELFASVVYVHFILNLRAFICLILFLCCQTLIRITILIIHVTIFFEIVNIKIRFVKLQNVP